MTKFPSSTVTGALGWNANGSLGSLNITDPFSTANTQNCSFTADDLSRIAQANCGTIWGQTFAYDPFGNIQKTQSAGSGTSFTPTYATSPITNRVASVGGTSATYDANGNSLSDTFRTFTWDADNNTASIGSVNLTYDAFDRMVEQSVGITNSEIVYSPAAVKLALMGGTGGATLTKAFVPLTGGDTAVYTPGGLAYYRHTDHLGSSRFASTPSQTLYADYAYAPFGEPYAQSGAIDPSFTGQNQDTTAGLYDFLFREQDPHQSRWTSSDPAGLDAVNPAYPQSWNRYAYVSNDPGDHFDPLGLCTPGTPCQCTPSMHCLSGVACRYPQNFARCPNEPPGISDMGNFSYGDMEFEFMMIGYTPPEIIGWQLVGFQNGVAIPGGCDPGDPSCFNNEFPIYGPPSVPSVGLYQAIVVTPGQEQSTLDARANALAHALNATGVQSLGNPCTIVAFYGVSAVGGAGGGAALGGEAGGIGATVVERAAPYWPAAASFLYSQAMRGFPIIRFIDNTSNRVSNAIQSGCNAMQ